MKKRLWKKAIAVCLCIAMCIGVITVPQEVHADTLTVSDTLEEKGGIWKFIATETEGIYYVQNVKEQKYLASSGGFLLSEEPYPIQAIQTTNGGYKLDFRTTANPSEGKRYLSVGSNNFFSLGEQHFKDMFMFEKSIQDGNAVYTSTSEITDGKEYVLAMEHKTTAGTLYALLSQTNGSAGDAARAYSEAVTVNVVVIVSETWEDLTEAGVLWNFEKSDDESGWYMYNIKAGKYLSDDGAAKPNIALGDTPVKYTVNLQEDGTFQFFNDTAKPYPAVGGGYKFSIGEQRKKDMALFEKVRIPEGFALQKATEIREDREYVLAMAYREDTASTANATVLYALTDQLEGSGSSARILSFKVNIKDDEILFITNESDAAYFGKPAVTVTEPEAGKAPQDVQVSIPYALDGEYTVTTAWSPQADSFELGQPYTVKAEITASGAHYFDTASLPTRILLGGGKTAELAEGKAALSEDGKTMTVSYTFAAIEDVRQTPEYEVPKLPTINLGTKLGDIVLPAGFSFEEASDTVLNTKGTFTYHLTYTPDDLDKWKVVSGIEIVIAVDDTRQTPDYTMPVIPVLQRGTKLGDIDLPAGFSFEEDADTALDAVGSVKYRLTYTPEDTNTYKPVTTEITLTVKESVASFEAEGLLWRFEKASAQNGWYLKNMATGLYLSDDGTDYSSSNETPRIALNDSPIQYEAILNSDGTFELKGGSSGKPYLAVGSGNRISIGETKQKTVLFEKVRDGSGLAYRKVQEITDGHEYIVAMAHRNNDATTATASSLFALTNQMYNNNRILSYSFSIVGDKIDVVSGEADVACLQTPVITICEPKAGNAQEPASAEILYALENEYQAATVWTPAADKFVSGTAYTAAITITARGTHYFNPDKLPERIALENGGSIALSQENCKISGDNKVITVNLSFAALSQAYGVTVAEGIENGTVTADAANVNVGSEVTVTAVPAVGYELKELKAAAGDTDISCTDAGNGVWKFTMPKGNVTMYAEFSKIAYEVKTTGLEDGTTDGLPESASYGDVVEFGIAPREGFAVKSLKVTEQESGRQLTLTEQNGRYSFTMPAAAVLMEAKFTRGEYKVNVEQAAYGRIELSQGTAKAGVNIFVTLNPQANYEVQKVTVRAADGKEIVVSRLDDTFYLFSMPGQNVTVSAVFAAKKTDDDRKPMPPAGQDEKLNAPVLASVKSTKTGVAIAWGSVPGAASYDVYRTVSGKQVKVANTSSCSYLDQAAVSGKANSYSVTAVAADPEKNSAQSAAQAVTLPANVKNLKVKAKKGSLTVSFQKVSGAKKYLVYRAAKKNGGYSLVKTLDAKKTSYTDKKVKKGKSYYYKIVVMKGSAYSIPTKIAGKKAK